MPDPGTAPGVEEQHATASDAEQTDALGDAQSMGEPGTESHGVLSEDEQPSAFNARVLTEWVPPARDRLRTAIRTFDLPEHHAKTQRRLAFATLGLAGLLYVGAGICLAFDVVSDDQFSRLTAAFSPFTALAAGAIGFYFGKKD
ncbi:hypothetical protein RI697_15820 (plasmid) [Clavibacter michiganensis]|uniref:hypothetical protein n=1 Tax=Clavibacter michiganensis TaxID=28447 RepID=UPI003DA13DB5